MLTSLKSLLGYRLRAVDGHIGKVRDFHFDNGSWALRHMAVSTHVHFPWPVVLIEPKAMGRPDWVDETVPVFHTMQEVREAPRLVKEPPLYREVYDRTVNFSGYIPHWTPIGGEPGTDTNFVPQDPIQLRSLTHLLGYRVHAERSLVGHVHDFLADDDWNICAMVARLELFTGEHYVAVGTEEVAAIEFSDQFIRLSLERSMLENAPEYDPLQPRQPDAAIMRGTHTSGMGR
jgi:hypothetical protein